MVQGLGLAINEKVFSPQGFYNTNSNIIGFPVSLNTKNGTRKVVNSPFNAGK